MKQIFAAALAAAFVLPAYAQDDQSASTGSSRPEASAAQAEQAQETWYYPDGSMAYRRGDTIIVVQPNGEVRSPPSGSDPETPARANGDELG